MGRSNKIDVINNTNFMMNKILGFNLIRWGWSECFEVGYFGMPNFCVGGFMQRAETQREIEPNCEKTSLWFVATAFGIPFLEKKRRRGKLSQNKFPSY